MKVFNFFLFRVITLVVFLFSGLGSLQAQSVYIYGSSSVTQGSTTNYYQYTVSSASWFGWLTSGGTVVNSGVQYASINWNNPGTHTLGYDAYSNGNYFYGNLSVTVSGSSLPSTPNATITKTNNCGNTVLTRTTNPPSGVTWYWQSSSSGTSTSSSGTSITLSSGTSYYLRARNTSGQWSLSSQYISYTITQPQTWYADLDGDGLGDPNTTQSQCGQPANYVSNNTDQCPEINSPDNSCSSLRLSDENYVYTRSYQVERSVPVSTIGSTDVIESVTYMDGLGRPVQTINIKASPTGWDIVTPMTYDSFGREDKKWLPRPDRAGYSRETGEYWAWAYNSTEEYYMFENENYSDEVDYMEGHLGNPFSQKGYDESPLNRVVEQAAPGFDWRLGGGHSIKFDNKTNIAADNVKLYQVDLTGSVPVLKEGATTFYPAGELYRTITKDENHDGSNSKNHTTEEFKNKQDKVVLKRTYGDSDLDMNGTIGSNEQGIAHDTYYVYDDFGNLTYVLSPKIDAANKSVPQVITMLNELGYQYKYDHRNRLIEKKIPGKGWEMIVYNKLDQPIMTQDSLQAGKSPKEWLFTKYDAFGRVTYTGLFKSNLTRAQHQANADAEADQYENTQSTALTYGGGSFYYTDNAYPDLSSNSSNVTLFTVNYYDDYRFYGASLPSTVYSVAVQNYNNSASTKIKTKGLATGSKVRVLTTNDWITTVMGYDKKGRVIYSKSDNPYLQTTDELKTKLDFVGKVVETTSVHTKTGQSTITTIDKYTYDHMGRLTKQTQKINSQAEELIALNEYDELGQLKTKKVGNTTTAPLQTVDYTYNIRGWLKTINNPSSLGNDLFGFRINYNTTETGTTGVNPLYNGNISETLWRTSNDNALRSYAYQYDPLNRIKKAVSSESGRYTLNSSIYDKNGNITFLSRNGQTDSGATLFGEMDKLYYAYTPNSNKLLIVDDRATYETYGFKDDVTGSTIDGSNDYTYDVNGNLKTDGNKGITSTTSGFIYNHLNLPESVTISEDRGDGIGTISYVYDATGVKLKKIAPGNLVTEYAGNYIYEAGALKFFNQPEGYVEKVGTAYKYVYQYKDHLGSIRLAYKNIGTTASPSLRIEEQHHYYPFGLKQQYAQGTPRSVNISNHQYGYNGKEEQNEKGVKWLDFGARNYDPAIGRWMNVDPLAETMPSHSPYNYAFNNPLRFTDPTGLSPEDWVKRDGKWTWDENVTSAEQATAAGYDDYRAPGSIIDNATINGQSGSDGKTSVYLGQDANDVSHTYPNSTITPFQVGTEWLSGEGPRNREFTNGDYFTELLRQHDHVGATKLAIENELANGAGVGLSGSEPYSLGGVQGVGKYVKDYSTLATAGQTGNLAVTYLGSYSLNYSVTDITNGSATIQFTVGNSSTMQSASRPPVLGYSSAWQNTVGKAINNYFSSGWGSRTTQSFNWTETIKID